MSIYKDILEQTKYGAKVSIDLKQKNLSINKKDIIKGGDILVDDVLINDEDIDDFEISGGDYWKMLLYLYKVYKYSAPREHDRTKSYFIALPSSELSDGDLAYNPPRRLAQVALEGFILLSVLAKKLIWIDESRWFYQNEEDKNLVLLKEWF